MPDLSLEQVAEIVETSEANMWRTMWESASPQDAAAYGISWQEIAGATALSLQAIPNAVLFNRVIGLGIREPVTETVIDDLIAHYTSLNTILAIPLSPAAQPSQLLDWLLDRGFRHTSNLAKMIRTTEPITPIETDLVIKPVDESTSAQVGKVIQMAFGMPDWIAPWFTNWMMHPGVYGFLAYDGDIPVGAGGIAIDGDRGSCGAGGTLPGYRGRGSQKAIFNRRIEKAAEMGCQWVTTETGESHPERPNPSYLNMVRTGFELAYLQPWYVYDPRISDQPSS